MSYPKFEKVNDNTVRIIVEKADEVPLAKLLELKKMLEEKLAQMTATLNHVNKIIANAEQLGITVPEKDNQPKDK